MMTCIRVVTLFRKNQTKDYWPSISESAYHNNTIYIKGFFIGAILLTCGVI